MTEGDDGISWRDAEDQPTLEDSHVDETIMAVDWKSQDTVGCAFFNTADGTLAVTEDIPMATLDVVEHFIVQVQPTTVLVSSRTSDQLLKILEDLSQPAETGT